MIGTEGSTHRIGFYLLPRFSLIALIGALEPLRLANRLSERRLYRYTLLGRSGEPVDSSADLPIPVSAGPRSRDQYDAVFVVGGEQVHLVEDDAAMTWLRSCDRGATVLGALCTGTHFLARAELLDGYRCTLHWEYIASAREDFPHLVISPELYEIDRDRYTCAGGTASIDMMLAEIRATHGHELATAIAEQLMCDRIRDGRDRQRVPLTQRIGASQPRLAEAVSLMEANIEEPMTLDELSHHVGLSRRQLERLFQRYLDCVPTRYYLRLRLHRARQLLLQTSMPIVDVALACGFVSAPHFSKCYRDAFGLPPRDERRRATGLLRDDATSDDDLTGAPASASERLQQQDLVGDQREIGAGQGPEQ